MKSKFALGLLLWLAAFPLSAQDAPATRPPAIRAVVVGISEYADERIPDLRFAHADAQAFADFLKSPAGGELPDENIVLLTNGMATAGRIVAALDWLINESASGDRAFLYFSGHGDVERLTRFQRGYLLAVDAPATTYMAGGTIAVTILEDIVTTLSEAGIQVVVVTDACRAGKLAGSANGGARATTSALAQQFAHEVKVLSCQPDEFSLEGEQWGGGRGCFSFHLLDGLTGLADRNGDGTVSLLEIGKYLDEHVPKEAAPQSQFPMTVGNKNAFLARVDSGSLALILEKKKSKLASFSKTDGKGFAELALARSSAAARQLYTDFEKALQRGELLRATRGRLSADECLRQLQQTPGAEPIRNLATRNLAAALQDEAQVVLNQLLRTEPQVVDDAFSPVSKYDHLPAYLARAAELLGPRHFMHRFVKSREHFFRSKTWRAGNFPGLSADSLLNLAQTDLDSALVFDEEAAHVWLEKGCLEFFSRNQNEGAMRLFRRAAALSPGSVMANYFIGRYFSLFVGDMDSARVYLLRAARLDSLFLPTYAALGWVSEESAEQTFWFEQYVRKMERYAAQNPGHVPAVYYNYLGNCLVFLKRYVEAEQVLLTGERISNGNFPLIYNNLALNYLTWGKYAEAEAACKKLTEQMPVNPEGFDLYGDLLWWFQRKPPQAAIPLYRKAVQLGWKQPNKNLVGLYLETGQLDSAEQAARAYELGHPKSPRSPSLHALVYFKKGLPDSARAQLEKMRSMAKPFDPNEKNFETFYYLTAATLLCDPPKTAAQKLEQWRRQTNDAPQFYFWVARAQGYAHRTDAALDWLEKAFKKGWQPPLIDPKYEFLKFDFLELLRTKRYQKLMRKYFPELLVE